MLMMATTTTNDFFSEPVWGFLTKRMTVSKEAKVRTQRHFLHGADVPSKSDDMNRDTLRSILITDV